MTKRGMKSEVTAYRLWCAARSLNWDCTIAEAAFAAGVQTEDAVSAARREGWRDRFQEHDKQRHGSHFSAITHARRGIGSTKITSTFAKSWGR